LGDRRVEGDNSRSFLLELWAPACADVRLLGVDHAISDYIFLHAEGRDLAIGDAKGVMDKRGPGRALTFWMFSSVEHQCGADEFQPQHRARGCGRDRLRRIKYPSQWQECRHHGRLFAGLQGIWLPG
jgi:hypothetical protein